MDREIYCKECGAYLGVIRDAKLRKDLVVLCSNCHGEVPYEEPKKYNNKPTDDSAVDDLMKIFGMRR